MEIEFSPKRLAWIFSVVVFFSFVAHVITQVLGFLTGDEFLFGLVPLFSVGSDGNLPTFYSAFAILFCSFLLTLIGFASREDKRIHYFYWFGLALVFLFLAIDEMLMLHERAIEPVREAFDASGIFYYAWVIPYGIALLIFGAIYLRFLFRLPSRTARLFVIAGTMYVVGAVGMEMLGGWYFAGDPSRDHDVIFVAIQTVEELLEMAGIIVFIYALADYAVLRFDGFRLRLG